MKATADIPVKREKVEPRPAVESPIMRLRYEVDDVLDRFLGEMSEAPLFHRMMEMEPFWGWQRKKGWQLTPKVDVSESETAYTLTAELAGMDEKDVELVLDDQMLMLKGEKKEEHEEQDKDYRLNERRFGSFQRVFRLPESVDEGKVSAKFAKGVLHVTLPKSKESQLKQRRIPIKAA